MTSFKSRDTSIKSILAAPPIGSRIRVRGWVRTRRDSKGLSFLEINDGSCLGNLQVVAESSLPCHDDVLRLSTGASIEVAGLLVESPGKGQTAELRAEEIIIHGLSRIPIRSRRKGIRSNSSAPSPTCAPAQTPSAPSSVSAAHFLSPSTASFRNAVSSMSTPRS